MADPVVALLIVLVLIGVLAMRLSREGCRGAAPRARARTDGRGARGAVRPRRSARPPAGDTAHLAGGDRLRRAPPLWTRRLSPCGIGPRVVPRAGGWTHRAPGDHAGRPGGAEAGACRGERRLRASRRPMRARSSSRSFLAPGRGPTEALRVMLNLAVQWGRLSDNPAAGLRLPKAPRERHRAERVLDARQLATLFDGTPRVQVESMLRMAEKPDCGGARRTGYAGRI